MRNGRFNTSKKWGCCTPILPKALTHFPNFQKKIQKIKIFKKMGPAQQVQASTRGRPLAIGRCLNLSGWPIFFEFFFLPALHFLRM
jgi:hypothetical protein